MRTGSVAYQRYTNVAILLHWTIALLIIYNLVTGLLVDDVSKPVRAVMMPLHISSGITILVLSLGRIAWRLTHRPPPLNPILPRYERILALTVHALFYVSMIVMPLIGWAIVSAHPPKPDGTITLWGALPWPVIGPIAHIQPAEVQKNWRHLFEDWHGDGGWIMLGLLALHLGGALKQQWIDKMPELQRMGLGR